MSNTLKFSTKTYIRRTWQGIRDFFTQYVGVLPGLKTRLNLNTQDVNKITDAAAYYGRLNDLIVAVEAYLASLRITRHTVVAQPSGDLVQPPDFQRVNALVNTLGNPQGGLLWLEDRITDSIKRNPAHTEEDLRLLGVVFTPAAPPNPEAYGHIYPQFTGGDVRLHWVLPRGISDARVSRIINHGEPTLIYQGSTQHYTDTSPIPKFAEVWAYMLEPMLNGTPFGKPITNKIVVGQDITVEEQTI